VTEALSLLQNNLGERIIDPNTMHEDEHTAVFNNRIRQIAWVVIALLAVFLLAFGGGYLKWRQDETAEAKQQEQLATLHEQVNPPDGFALSISYGDLGPRLVEGGVIDYAAFAAIYEKSSNPLTPQQVEILKNGSKDEIIITAQNAHFLLNFFWAVGLANKNSILTEGPMVQDSQGLVERFASTGGWTLATRTITELYASMDLILLTAEQQKLVEEVAAQVYRPCCGNHRLFPDCNHGMALLGTLELMASEGANADEMFEAAKDVNAFWFPQQTLETAIYLQLNENVDFRDADAKLVVSKKFSSAAGSSMVHQDLQRKGAFQQSPGQGGSCANGQGITLSNR
jgi:hypothetical protein